MNSKSETWIIIEYRYHIFHNLIAVYNVHNLTTKYKDFIVLGWWLHFLLGIKESLSLSTPFLKAFNLMG